MTEQHLEKKQCVKPFDISDVPHTIALQRIVCFIFHITWSCTVCQVTCAAAHVYTTIVRSICVHACGVNQATCAATQCA